jgi:hypothetical protein
MGGGNPQATIWDSIPVPATLLLPSLGEARYHLSSLGRGMKNWQEEDTKIRASLTSGETEGASAGAGAGVSRCHQRERAGAQGWLGNADWEPHCAPMWPCKDLQEKGRKTSPALQVSWSAQAISQASLPSTHMHSEPTSGQM